MWDQDARLVLGRAPRDRVVRCRNELGYHDTTSKSRWNVTPGFYEVKLC